MNPASVTQTGIELIKQFEGFRSAAYPDPGSGGEPWTIGYGSTFYLNGVRVKKGDVIRQKDAEQLLKIVVQEFADQVFKLLKKRVTQNQFNALVSFSYNVGAFNLKSSTLLKKVNTDPHDLSIRSEFMKWNRAAGKVMDGLTRRRRAEADLYFTP